MNQNACFRPETFIDKLKFFRFHDVLGPSCTLLKYDGRITHFREVDHKSLRCIIDIEKNDRQTES